MYTARIRMPRMGTSVHESTVVAWKKAVGDTVAKGEVLLSAESDKVEFEVEAPADGVITEILAEAEQTVPVGEVLATMETETEVADETPVQDRGASDDWAAPVAPLQPREKPVIPAPQARKAPLPSDKKTWLSPRVQNPRRRAWGRPGRTCGNRGHGSGRKDQRARRGGVHRGRRHTTQNRDVLGAAQREPG